jgi:hypothetical protein
MPGEGYAGCMMHVRSGDCGECPASRLLLDGRVWSGSGSTRLNSDKGTAKTKAKCWIKRWRDPIRTLTAKSCFYLFFVVLQDIKEEVPCSIICT